jgi:CMP-N,N'-diacetyllegionaminic acid synthase
MSVLGIVMARAGSKRLPGKNLADLGGKPLIAHTCEAALAAGVLDAVYVNTDCPQIASAALDAGVTCPALRPAHLAADDTSSRDSNLFLLDLLAKRGERYDAIVMLQATSPLRAPEDIRDGLKLFEQHAPCQVVAVTPLVPQSWLGRIAADQTFERWTGDETVYRVNGALYVYPWDEYVEDRLASRTVAYPMPPERSVDIDRIEDLEYARSLYQRTEQAAHVR